MSCSSFEGQFEVAPRYYSDKSSEIDFVLQNGTEIIPVEAKGGEDKSAPSFKRYIADRHPSTRFAFPSAAIERTERSQTSLSTLQGKPENFFELRYAKSRRALTFIIAQRLIFYIHFDSESRAVLVRRTSLGLRRMVNAPFTP